MRKNLYSLGVSIFIIVFIMTFSLVLNAGEKFFCSLCHKEISGSYVRFKDGTVFCKECMQKPKCIECGKPTLNMVQGEPLCLSCAEHPNICRECGKLLGRKFIVFPLSSGRFCRECVNSLPKCRFCSSPTNETADNGEGWYMCSECKQKAVYGIDSTQQVLSEVQQIIGANIHLTLKSPAALELCPDIVKEGRKMNGDEMGLMQQHGSTSVILIQDGLPKELVYETLAHEWAHAWVAQHARYKPSLKVEEGFCQWVASKVLIYKGFDASLNILRTRKDIYGSGYRKLEKMEISRGVNGVTDYVCNTSPGLFKKLFGKKR